MSTALAKRDDIEEIHVKSQYSADVIDSALLACAHFGNSVQASKHLAAAGIEVGDSTLRYWRTELYPKRYRAIALQHGPEIEKTVVVNARQAALAASEGINEAIALERQRLASGDVKDASGSAQRLSLAMGINVDKVLVLEGRPSQITEHRRDANDIVTELSTLAPGLFVDGQAEEIHADKDQEARGQEIPREETSTQAQPQQEA